MGIKDTPTAEPAALVEQGLPLAEYEAEIERRKALAAVPRLIAKPPPPFSPSMKGKSDGHR